MIYLKTSNLPANLRAGLRTKKHKVGLAFADSATLFGGWWDGGSRSTYWMIDLATGRTESLSYPTSPPGFGGTEVSTATIPFGKAIAKGGTFCGKDATVFLYVNPGIDRSAPALVIADHFDESGMPGFAAAIRTAA